MVLYRVHITIDIVSVSGYDKRWGGWRVINLWKVLKANTGKKSDKYIFLYGIWKNLTLQ